MDWSGRDFLEVRRRTISAVGRASDALLPTDLGVFRTIAYVDRMSGHEHLALIAATSSGTGSSVEVHIECRAGQVLRSTSCECRQRFRDAMGRTARGETDVLLYLRSDARFAPCVGPSHHAPGLLRWITRSILDDLGHPLPVAHRPDRLEDRLRSAG